ncbi:hypothetical protein RND71_015020 [Anisodus tanguticus]|uniref:ABC-2 type transporter transmembrane domain-containing protein n=1 Tax=Anisodus tanguticus TaxID=243964 RepID=A0AAE1SBQ5_9SOLA|nr:hypothetical protein RND71_015020 [Anisodus tanguticus]
MELVDLNPLRDSLVGLPGVDGLSTEQRKRLTIAVELVATPSIIFMDEQTSGLDARAAAIVMRAVRNTVDTGTTVVCTIHQPSIDIFEAFDESVPGVPGIEEGTNPAIWMLDISATAVEAQLQVVFADIYANSELYRSKQQDLLNIIGATYAAVMFLGGTNTSAMQSVVSVERTVFYREKAAGMYSALHYAFAQPYSLRNDWIPLIGWKVLFVLLFCFHVLRLLHDVWNDACCTHSELPHCFYCNVFLPQLLELVLRFPHSKNVAWTIYGLVRSQVGDKNNPIEIPGGGEVSLELYLKDSYGFEYDFLGVDAVHVSWAVLFCFIFAYAIKFFNFQRR